jgi:DNA-binding NarL/FixJ family response regulator
MPSPARIVLVEDDAAVRRFVSMALSELDIDLVECVSAEQAIGALRERPAQLVITDLTLPGASGVSLIEQMVRNTSTTLATKVVVFSGGLHSAMRDRLKELGVWRCLPKPASLSEIEAVVREGLDLVDWPDQPEQASLMHQNGLQPHELAAIENYFDGDRQFYETYRDSCIAQFHVDINEGDVACQAKDAVSLRRTAHSLKSVLQTLGYADHSVCAKALEEAVQQQPWASAEAGWRELRERMVSSFRL